MNTTTIARRCDRHADDLFAPTSCAACDELNIQPVRLGFIPGTQCARHPYYPLVTRDGRCDACLREDI